MRVCARVAVDVQACRRVHHLCLVVCVCGSVSVSLRMCIPTNGRRASRVESMVDRMVAHGCYRRVDLGFETTVHLSGPSTRVGALWVLASLLRVP